MKRNDKVVINAPGIGEVEVEARDLWPHLPVDVNAVKELIEDVNKDNPGSMFILGAKGHQLDIERISTGLPDLDRIIGGGLPMRRVIQIYGPESAGKTSLATLLMSKFQLAAFIDAEGTMAEDRLPTFGVDRKRVIFQRPETMEEAWKSIRGLVKANIRLIVVDSIPALTPRAEAEEEDPDKDTAMAIRARYLSRKLPYLGYLCNKHGSTVVLINQVRDKFNAMRFGETTVMPGGRALKHQSSLIIKIARKEWLESAGEALAQVCKIVIQKSKVSSPMGEAEVWLIFDQGFITIPSTKEERLAVLREARKRSLARQKEDPSYIPLKISPDDDTPRTSLEQLEKEAS